MVNTKSAPQLNAVKEELKRWPDRKSVAQRKLKLFSYALALWKIVRLCHRQKSCP
jgi:hypothetical protein